MVPTSPVSYTHLDVYKRQAYYPSTQLFLILFVLFYVGIAIAYALRQAPRLRHYVDGTLVFGTPLLAFGMQYGLVHAMPFGAAFSALAFGLFYTSVALALWRRRTASLGLLTESFIALGIVFGTLALPLALDGRWTSAAWALEGAAMVWVGLRPVSYTHLDVYKRQRHYPPRPPMLFIPFFLPMYSTDLPWATTT